MTNSFNKNMARLRSLNEIPAKYRAIFSKIKQFNHVQSEVFDDVMNTKKHIVVSAPTGSGKTKIFELAIVKLLIGLEQTHVETENVKIIYVAPTKALCNEIFGIWQKKFASFGLNVGLATGDSDPAEMVDLSDLSAYQIVITTPEKCDAMTRRWKDQYEIAQAVRLVLIDEVQLVGDTCRGPTLEAIVSRIKTFPMNRQIRFVSVSASLPNIEDIAKWLGADRPSDSVRTYQIEEAKRPVKLDRRVIGYQCNGNWYQFNVHLTYELSNLVRNILPQRTSNEQILIFCQSRNDVESSLNQLKNIRLEIDAENRFALKCVAKSMKDELLQTSVAVGLAFHHAGLSFEDRERVEEAYRDGLIRILLSTNTLAMGVNLPAHTVIIKSTERFINGATVEISESMLLQMMGRAGRQQFHTTGCVYIMTKKENVEYYKKLATSTTQIESHLSNKLAEFLNAEIVLNTITDAEASMERWFRTTFLYARTAKRKPTNQANADLKNDCQRAIEMLKTVELIESDLNGCISSLPFGTVMAKYFLSITTMQAFRGFRGHETESDILDKIVYCSEFSEFYLRKVEKKTLNDIKDDGNGKRIRYQIPGKITNKQQKASCLLQAVLGHIPIETTSLRLEADKMVQIAERMVNSLIEYFLTDQFAQNCYVSIHSATTLAKSLKARTWENLHFRQVLNLDEKDVNKLIRSNINSVHDLLKTNPREIEDILKKEIPFGNELIDEVAKKLPCYDMNVDVMAGHVIRIRVEQSNIHYKYEGDGNDALTLIVGDSCNYLILYENIQSAINTNGCYEKLLCYTPSAHAGSLHLIHQTLVGADRMVRFKASNARNEETSSTISEMGVSSTTSVSTNVSKDTMPPRAPIGHKKANPVKMVKSKQQSMLQYFKIVRDPQMVAEKPPMKSVFDGKRAEPVKKIVHSPNLFESPETEIVQVPQQMYDFSYATANVSPDSIGLPLPMTNIHGNDKENSPPGVNSPSLIQTQLKSKMNEQIQARNAINGFVCAKAICKKDIGNGIQPDRGIVPMVPNQSNHSSSTNVPTSTNELDCELDDEFMNVINDELSELNASKPGIDNTILHNLRLNLNHCKSDTIRKDFDDYSQCSDNLEALSITKHPKSLNSDNHKSFFSIGADADSEKDGEVQTSSVTDGVTRAIPRKTASVSGQMAILPIVASKNTALIQSPPSQIIPCSQSPASAPSYQAVCGSPIRQAPPPPAENRHPASKRTAINDYIYVPPPQIQTSADYAQPNRSNQRVNFLVPDSPEPKPKRSCTEELLRKKSQPNEYTERIRRLSEKSQPKNLAIGKMGLKYQFASVSRPVAVVNQDADEVIKQNRERLQTDENYKENDFYKDYSRAILGNMPKHDAKSPSNEEHSFFLFDDDDDCLSEFDMSPMNDHYGKSQFCNGRTMNLANQGVSHH